MYKLQLLWTLNLLIQKWKNVNKHVNDFIEKQSLHLRNVDRSSSAWEYHLSMQPYGNIYSYSISNEVYQQLTQHTVGHTSYRIEDK